MQSIFDVINYSDSSPFIYCLMTLPATFNGEEPPVHEEQQRLKQLHIEPSNWKSVKALPTTLIVAKFVSVYLAPSNIYVDLAMALCSL
ncbi:MAG: hypothetical protein QXW72_01815 [Conexivisphaerales archaeon]